MRRQDAREVFEVCRRAPARPKKARRAAPHRGTAAGGYPAPTPQARYRRAGPDAARSVWQQRRSRPPATARATRRMRPCRSTLSLAEPLLRRAVKGRRARAKRWRGSSATQLTQRGPESRSQRCRRKAATRPTAKPPRRTAAPRTVRSPRSHSPAAAQESLRRGSVRKSANCPPRSHKRVTVGYGTDRRRAMRRERHSRKRENLP